MCLSIRNLDLFFVVYIKDFSTFLKDSEAAFFYSLYDNMNCFKKISSAEFLYVDINCVDN